MSKTAIGVFTPEDARSIKAKVLNDDHSYSLHNYGGKVKLGWHYVILKDNLLPATNPLTGYSRADAAVLMYVQNVDTLDMEEVEPEEFYIEIVNRSPFISGSTGDVALVRWVVKEWAVVWCAASSLRHGIITEDLGCGYYTVELGVWNGDLETAGSGIGSETSGEDRNCDVCYDVVNAGTSDCAITLSYPPVQVTGIGQFVTAYHRASVLVPLVVGSACMLTGTGSDASTSDGTYISSGTGVDNVWQIVDGLQTHTVQYNEEWSCCEPDGPETLISKTPVIFAAKVCDPISCGECP